MKAILCALVVSIGCRTGERQGAVPVLAMQPAVSAPPAPREVVAPFALTASDGSGLAVTRIDAKAVVQGPLAFTELHLYFHNPEPRIREGTFAITLPAGASVSRFAMELDGRMQEAEVVEKTAARRIYDDFLHRKQDPALLEQAAGNQFTAKVFPIAPAADKHLVVSYAQLLRGGGYVLPLRGLPKIDRVDVTVTATHVDGSVLPQTLVERAWQPDRDFVAALPPMPAAVAAPGVVVAAVPVAAPRAKPAPVTELTLLVDTSASRALGFGRYVASVRALVGALAADYGAALPVQVVAFDQDTQAIYAGPASGYGEASERVLLARGAAGASDLGQAIAKLRAPHRRVVVVTDGVVTAGADTPALAAAIGKLPADRVDVVLAGGIRDERTAAAIARAGRRPGDVLDLDRGAREVATALGAPVLADVRVRVPGATWSWPRTVPAGTTLMVFARLPATTQTLEVDVGDERRALAVAAATPAIVERAVAAAEIDELEGRLAATRDPSVAEVLRADIARRSIAHRVISSQTAMLVLETEADYARYKLDRKPLADDRDEAPRDDAGAGTIGRGNGTGYGAGGARGRGPSTRLPTVTIAQPEVTGSLDRQLLRRYIKRNIQKIRYCYERELLRDPTLAGTVTAQFTIAAEGKVTASSASGVAPAVSACIADAIRGIEFPRMVAIVHVTYPFTLVPADARGVTSPPPPDLPRASGPAITGKLADIEQALHTGATAQALQLASAWHAEAPGDVLALIGYGEALEAAHDVPRAARIYGSIIDLFPARADMRRFAGERLERLGAPARDLVIDTYRRAVADRPDHATGHRLLAYALVRRGDYAGAFAAILAGVDLPYSADRFQTLADDAGMIGAAYIAHGGPASTVTRELTRRSLALATGPSTRFILYWETDANDVDFHIRDRLGGHASYQNKTLPSGGSLYADITTGYGPECFAIPGTPTAGPYQLSIYYFSQGPMGYGMGLLQAQRFDGKRFTFEDRPFVIMVDRAFVDLGAYP